MALAKKAEDAGVVMMIDYQRTSDPRIAALLADVGQRKEAGFKLDYVSVFSCDKAVPPQAGPQYLSQACHDYALLHNVLEAAGGLKVQDVQSRGLNWQGTDDTHFFKITG